MQVPLCLFYESSWHLGSVFWGNYAAVLWCFRVLQLWGGPSTVFGAAVMTEKQLLVLFSMFRSMSAVVLVRTTVVCVGSFPGAVLGWKRQIIIRFKSHSLLMVENHSMQTVSEINCADQLLWGVKWIYQTITCNARLKETGTWVVYQTVIGEVSKNIILYQILFQNLYPKSNYYCSDLGLSMKVILAKLDFSLSYFIKMYC